MHFSPFSLILFSHYCSSRDALSCQTEESFVSRSTERLSRQDSWQVVPWHSSADNGASVDSMFRLEHDERSLENLARDWSTTELPLKYSIQLWIVSGGSVSFMCFRASSSSTSPVGVSDFRMIFLKSEKLMIKRRSGHFKWNVPT